MEPEVDVWTTKLFNAYLAGPANAVLDAVHRPHDPAHPWSNWMTMEILVFLIIVVLVAGLRPKLSMDRPNKLQHFFEAIFGFLKGQSEEAMGHHGFHFVPFFGTLFIFILFMNLIGLVPGFEAPTMSPAVPLGCALAVFFYYNFMGMREHGVGKYLAHFAGPTPALAPLMIPIELISHLARPLSLTIRLYANMFAGEQVTVAFLGLTYLVAPALFMGLHLFVAFLQAFIFALLTMIYVGGAIAHEH